MVTIYSADAGGLPKIDFLMSYDSLEKCEKSLDIKANLLIKKVKEQNKFKPKFLLDYNDKKIFAYNGENTKLYLTCKFQQVRN